MENPIKMDDLGVPPFLETSISMQDHAILVLFGLDIRQCCIFDEVALFKTKKTCLLVSKVWNFCQHTSLEGKCARVCRRRWRKTRTLNLTKSESLPVWSEPLVQDKHGFRVSISTLNEDGEIMKRHHSEWIKL